MSVYAYRNLGTNQLIYRNVPDFGSNPLWELVSSSSGGDGSVAGHEADTTNVHGIADTTALATTTGVTAAVTAHSGVTTNVHGIADTAVLETAAGASAKVTSHAAASDPHGDRSVAATALASHAALTSAVHGISDTTALETTTGSAQKVTVHTAASDPHGDRAAAAAALTTHAAVTTSVHGIANTANLATTASVTSAIAAHEADTTAVHGIADTSLLETTTGATAKVTAHAGAADPHGDRAFATSAIATHEADTTAVHGIADTSLLATTAGVTSAITTHAGASDPHGDRAYAAPALHASQHQAAGSDRLIIQGGHDSATRYESIPRSSAGANLNLTSGGVLFGYFTAPGSRSVTTLTAAAGATTGSSGLTLGKLGLYSVAGNGDLTLLQASTSDTTLFNTTSQVYTGTISSTALTAGQRYAIGILTIGSTAGSVRGAASLSGLTNLDPVPCRSFTGQSDMPGSAPNGSLNATGNLPYVAAS